MVPNLSRIALERGTDPKENAAPKPERRLSLELTLAQKPSPSYFFLNLETRPPVSIRRVPPPVQAG